MFSVEQHKGAGYLRRIPIPHKIIQEKALLTTTVLELANTKRSWASMEEFGLDFLHPGSRFLSLGDHDLVSTSTILHANASSAVKDYESSEAIIDSVVSEAFGLELSSELSEIGWTESPRPMDSISSAVSTFDMLETPDVLTNGLASYVVGVALGRWNIRYATGELQPPEMPDPFAPLPVCPPGMLQNSDGLPASESEVPENYPLRISWPGILVDDEGHPEDIITRVREALSVIWKDNSASIEQEACEILKVRSLRDYFAEKKSGGKFFKDHLKRYSKSRRKAPIYWPLSTESGSYTLWIYYHRLTDQTLYQCVSDFIEPKIEQCEKDLQMLNQQFELGQADGKTNDQISELKALINELKNFRDELLNVARLPYKPNLNDGVQITAAPLWKCFRLGAWQKTLKDTWKKLEKGDYDWAHLSYSIWPERVKDKCIKDKSLAIAHGLEDVYIEPPAKAKKAKKASTEALDLE